MKTLLPFTFVLLYSFALNGQNLPPLKVSTNHNYFVTRDSSAFFWLGGTAWELTKKLTKDEIDFYLNDRFKKGFTVIQAVIPGLSGMNEPNVYGEVPLIENDPSKLNDRYFQIVDFLISRADELGLYVALLPLWGNQLYRERFNIHSAEIYGQLIARRYLGKNNLIWILGGDIIPKNENEYALFRSLANGIRKVDSIHLMTFHPYGGAKASDYFKDSWMDFDMFQSGHGRGVKEYNFVLECKQNLTPKPIVNGEARYENIPDRFWENKDYGWLDDADVRVSAYWTIISGAAGYTYGCNDVFQFYDFRREPQIKARTDWQIALQLPGATQMGFMRQIFEAIPWQTMVNDQTLLIGDNPEDISHIVAAIGEHNDFIVAYTPIGKPILIDASRIQSKKITGFWFNPRSGKLKQIGEFITEKPIEFKPWSDGWGSDFLLILANQELSKFLEEFGK